MSVPSEIIAKLSTASSATLSTIMMRDYGLANTCIEGVSSINNPGRVMAGPAYTMRYTPGREDLLPEQWLSHPKNIIRPAIESMSAGIVVVMDSANRPDVGLLGGNLLARMVGLGINGVVAAGGMRDREEIMKMPMPVYSQSVVVPASFPTLMLVAVQEPIACGGVTVFPDDVIVGDADGVVVVPAHLAAELADSAPAMEEVEQWVHLRLLAGASLDGLYPPDEKSMAQYEAWVKAGRPADKLVV